MSCFGFRFVVWLLHLCFVMLFSFAGFVWYYVDLCFVVFVGCWLFVFLVNGLWLL